MEDPSATTRELRLRRRRWPLRLLLAAVLVAIAGVVAALVIAGGGGGRRSGVDVYRGLGAWIDVFDYVPVVGGDRTPVGPPDVDAMAAQGVRTIYLNAAFDSERLPGGVVPAELVLPILRRAHQQRINVVGWYAPRFLDPETDLRRLVAIARFREDGQRFDGIAVDIEDRGVADLAERNRRVVELSRRLRDQLGPRATIGAIVLPTVLLEDVNDKFWPGFPWAQIGPFYDVWLPMTYWTDRLTASGFRDPRTLIAASVSRMRQLTGRFDAPVHPIGGIGNALTEEELATYADTVRQIGAIGGSIYDYRTIPSGGWGILRGRVPD